MKPMIRFALVAAMAAFVAGCGSNVKLDESRQHAATPRRSTAAPVPAAPAAPPPEAGARRAGDTVTSDRTPLNDPKSPLAKRSIYFDFDSFVIKDEFRGTVDAHARYLLATRARRVVIQGNTDDRGSREYNLALGQKRAEAVRRAMSALGVPDAQMEAVSFGEERPRATGADEASYAENRRADLAYQ